MPEFNEDLLQFIWQHRLLKPETLIACSGAVIRVLEPGELNRHSGPDFSNGKILIGTTTLVGNIEIHKKSSDWLKHQHQSDPAYDRLILHVVYEHDREIPQNTLHQVEVLELKSRIDVRTFERYKSMMAGCSRLPCASQLEAVPDALFTKWVNQMTRERLESKLDRLQSFADSFGQDLTQTFYTLFLRNLGFSTNALPFELLARQLPIQLLLKHADQLLQLEALVMGCAGFLDEYFEAGYLRDLQNEFTFLSRKYNLVPLKKEIFKTSRMRPANFPLVRLAQLCQLIHRQSRFFMAPQLYTTYVEIDQVLSIQPEGYWKNHYRADGRESEKILFLGRPSRENLMINSFAPFLFYYGKRFGKGAYLSYALELLQVCKAEDNAKTRTYESKSTQIKTAAHSQGLIQLHDRYCHEKACLRCGLAAAILKTDKICA